MLTNFDLEEICRYYHVPLVTCTMKDELPVKIKDGNYIINLQSSKEGDGTHWTALIIRNDIALYFDSFGAPPSTEIIDFVKMRKHIHLAFNNEIIQDLTSSNCGYYCLALILYVKHHRSIPLVQAAENFTRLFMDDTKKNDGILREFFKNITKNDPPKPILKLMKQKNINKM